MFRSRAVPLVLSLALALGGATASLVSAPVAQAATPEAPVGLTPAAGAAVAGVVVLGWRPAAEATNYDVELSASADFATKLESVTGTVNLRTVPKVQLPEGELWWRVRSSNSTGKSAWSTESFRHTSQGAPVPVNPTDGFEIQPPDHTPRFRWQPVAGATDYTVQVSRDPSFTDPALITANTQRTAAAVLTGYQVVGAYYWRVRATLGSGYATAWSTPLRYEVKGLRPAVLTGPADGFAVKVRDVVLDWEPVPGAVTYQLQVSTDDGFLSVVHSANGVVGTSYTPVATLDNDEYYWRVRPVDASGNVAPWPETPWRFWRAWEDQPTLMYPKGTPTPGIPLFYEWTAIERASKYVLYVYDAAGKEVCRMETVHTTLSDKKCVPAAAGTYRWLVRATDEGGANPVTDLLAQTAAVFTYDPTTLGPDPVAAPAASISGTTAYGVGGAAREACAAALPATCVDLRQTPVLTWPAVPGATGYRLMLSYDRELTNLVSGFERIEVKSPMWTPVKTLPDSQAGSAYFWVVDPCFDEVCPPGLVRYPDNSFAKKTVAPILADPADDALVEDGISVSDDVTLSWGSALAAFQEPSAAVGSSLTTPASTEARSYVVQTSVDPAFGTTIDNATVNERTFTSPDQTYPEGIIYWRVRAADGSGNPTVWSQTRKFEKRSPVPTLAAPLDGADLAADYTLSWVPLKFAAGYDVDVYAGPTRVGGVTSWKHASWAPSDPYPVSDSYTWRVRRVDAKGRKGAWTAPRAFSIAGAVPALIAPDRNVTVASTTAYFQWESDPRVTSYRFERRKVGTTALVENVTTRATAWAPTAALAGGEWEWRVVALDAKASALGAAPWRPFTVVDAPAEVTAVSISGSGRVGTELRVSAPVFSPAVDKVTYQWYRGSTAIPGATGEVYTVVAADFGKAITVRATGTLSGYKSVVSTSAAISAAAGDALVAVTPPTVSGRGVVGQTLTAVAGTWPDGTRVTRQWLRNGDVISGATRDTYKLVAGDAGRAVAVLETAAMTGREPGTSRSQALPVGKVASSATLTLSAPRTTVKKRVTATVQVAAAGLGAPGGSVTFYDRKRKLSTVKLRSGATAVLRLPKLSRGKHVIKAVYSGAVQTKKSQSRPVRLKVTKR